MAGVDVPPPPHWAEELPAEPASVGAVRRALAVFARAHGADDRLINDLVLAVSEAATNAIVHAFTDTAPGRVAVRATPGDGRFHVVVADDGHGMRPRGDSPGLGLGLPTIAQLTESFDIRDRAAGGGTEVHMVFAAPGVRPPPEHARAALLADVRALTRGPTGWPGEGVDRLVALLVPAAADAAVVDLVEADGPRRVAATVDGDDGAAAWLLERPPRTDDALTLPALHRGVVHVTTITDEHEPQLRAFRHWVTVPLTEGGVRLGTLGLGLRAGRADPASELAFYSALGERAAHGLASTHLVDELRRTRRRLERILSALSEAVTVQDAHGQIVYANTAAARLLGAASVEEITQSRPGDLASRFVITREDGGPVELTDLPAYAVLAGAEEAQLLTRSVHRATGRERWLLTKATRLEDGEPFAVNIIDDITAAKTEELRRRVLAEAEALVAGAGPGVLDRLVALAVPAVCDWCAIERDGTRLAATAPAAPGAPRSHLAVPVGTGAALHLATVPDGRALGSEEEAFARALAARVAPAL